MVKHADIDHTGITGVGDLSGHTGDSSDAHDASAISVLDTAGNFTGTDVEAVLAELQDNIDAGGGGGGGAPFKFANSNAAGSNQNLTTAFADLFSGQLSQSIAASTNDVLRLEARVHNTNVGGAFVVVTFKVASTDLGDATTGVWLNFVPNGGEGNHHVVHYYTVQAGDISGGNVTVVPRVRCQVASGAITYQAPAAQFAITNLGTVA